MKKEEKISAITAYRAMLTLLEAAWQQTNSQELASLLGGMQLLNDWKTKDGINDAITMDPAAWHDWIKAIEHEL